MARPHKGSELLDKAKEMLAKTKDANELRMLQAVILPLAYGLTSEEVAGAVGKTPRWVTNARARFIKLGRIPENGNKKSRNRAHMTIEEEAAFLAPFIESAKQGGILVVGAIHEALEQRLGRKVATATTYNILHRHGWRKLAPDKRHESADPAAQEDWKKNSRRYSSASKKNGKGQAN